MLRLRGIIVLVVGFFFFNDTATTEIYTLSLHDALPIFHSSPVAFSITTLEEGRLLEVNAAFEARYGYSRQEVLGRTVHELGMWNDPADRRLLVTQLQRGGPIRNVITRLRAKSGEIKLTAYSADRIEFDG